MKNRLQKALLVAIAPIALCARDYGTNIGDFIVDASKLSMQKKFENDTSKNLLLHYQLRDVEHDCKQPGQVFIDRGGSVQVDFKKAIQNLQARCHKKSNQYEVKLSLEVVKKVPATPRTPWSSRRLKMAEKGLRITRNHFEDKDSIRFIKAVGNKIQYLAV